MSLCYGTREHWEQVARTQSAELPPVAAALLDSMLEQAPEPHSKRVLDIGTGNGHLPIALARRGSLASGIDVTAIGVERAKENAKHCRAYVDFYEMDAAALSFQNGAFDIVTCLRTLWCLPSAEACFSECGRVLSPQGKLLVQIYGPAEECPLLMLGARILTEVGGAMEKPKHFRGSFDFTPELLATLLENAGFAEVRFAEYAIEVEFSTAEAYWHTLRSIADSAYHAYTRLVPEFRGALAEAWERRAVRLRDENGVIRLGLTWLICSAEKV